MLVVLRATSRYASMRNAIASEITLKMINDWTVVVIVTLSYQHSLLDFASYCIFVLHRSRSLSSGDCQYKVNVKMNVICYNFLFNDFTFYIVLYFHLRFHHYTFYCCLSNIWSVHTSNIIVVYVTFIVLRSLFQMEKVGNWVIVNLRREKKICWYLKIFF